MSQADTDVPWDPAGVDTLAAVLRLQAIAAVDYLRDMNDARASSAGAYRRTTNANAQYEINYKYAEAGHGRPLHLLLMLAADRRKYAPSPLSWAAVGPHRFAPTCITRRRRKRP